MTGVEVVLKIYAPGTGFPFAGPIGCLEVGYCDGQIVLNPNQEQRKTSRMDVTVAATAEKVVMIEAGADEIPDEIMYYLIRRNFSPNYFRKNRCHIFGFLSRYFIV